MGTPTKSAWLLLALGFALWGCQSAPPTAPTSVGAADGSARVRPQRSLERSSDDSGFAGAWETTFGELRLQTEGRRVHGNYSFGAGASIEGEIASGGRFVFRYHEPPDVNGEGWFELDADGQSFAGEWREDGDGEWSTWVGRRLAPDATAPEPAGFAGRWRTSYGSMRLRVEGEDVTGNYSGTGRSTIEGKLSEAGRRLTFSYSEPDAQGEGWFVLDEGDLSFSGEWRETDAEEWSPWTGERVVPREDVVWLVILEANWEESLDEAPYDFGSMLRQYFTMAVARRVHVRHRFFHDEQSFKALAAQVAQLAEPAVLLVSAHGTHEGVVSAGGIISPEAIAAALQDVDNLLLLHLSGCDMMSGDVPERIFANLPATSDFPISGYRRSVAWDASALGDFTFLSLLLIRELSPAEAVRQTHLVSPYATDEQVPEAAFEPLGLELRRRRPELHALDA